LYHKIGKHAWVSLISSTKLFIVFSSIRGGEKEKEREEERRRQVQHLLSRLIAPS
jgi:hypothetical protein